MKVFQKGVNLYRKLRPLLNNFILKDSSVNALLMQLIFSIDLELLVIVPTFSKMGENIIEPGFFLQSKFLF